MRIIFFSIVCLKFSFLMGMDATQVVTELALQEFIEEIKRQAAASELLAIKQQPSLALQVFTAVNDGNKEELEILLENVEKDQLIRMRDNDGSTPLHYAAQNYRASLIPILINAGALVNDNGNVWKTTPLIWAVENRLESGFIEQKATILALLAAHADPTIIDGEGRSALSLAREYKARGYFIDVVNDLEAKMR